MAVIDLMSYKNRAGEIWLKWASGEIRIEDLLAEMQGLKEQLQLERKH